MSLVNCRQTISGVLFLAQVRHYVRLDPRALSAEYATELQFLTNIINNERNRRHRRRRRALTRP